MATPYDPSIPPGQGVNIDPYQIQALIDGINALNVNIRSYNEGQGAAAAGYRRDSAMHGHGPIEGAPEGHVPASQQDYETQMLRERQRQITVRHKFAQWEKANPNDKMSVLKKMGAVNDQGKFVVGGQEYSDSEIAKAFSTGNQNLINILNTQVAQEISRVVREQGPSKIGGILDAIQEAGIQQLRYGELPLQDILKAAGTLAGKAYERRYGGEEGSRTPGTLGGALRFMNLRLPEAGQAVAVAEVAGRIVRNVYENSFNDWYREPKLSGQLTGQGWKAGIAAELKPLKLFQPFGMVDWKTAQEIVQNTRERGFTGSQGNAVMQGMANTIGHLGIQVGQAADFFEQSMREGGMSVSQVVTEMNKFHDAAFHLNMNINDYTEQILKNTDTLREAGAGYASPGIAKALTAGVSVGYRGGEGQQYIQQAAERSRGMLAAIVGHGANTLNVFSQRYANRAYGALDQVLMQQVAFAENSLPPGQRSVNDIATRLSEISPYFEGMPVDFLAHYITQVRRGRGVSAQLTFSRQAQLYQERVNNSRFGSVQRIRTMTDEQLGRLNIKKELQGGSRGGGQLFYKYYDTATHQYVDPNAMRKTLSAGLDRTEAERVKHELITGLGNTLTAAQRKEIEQANPFEVSKILTRISQQTGKKVTIDTSKGFTVTISLANGATQKLFEVSAQDNTAVSSGAVQANTLLKNRYSYLGP